MGKVPNPRSTLSSRLRAGEDQTRRISNASPFFRTGVRPNGEGGLDSDTYEPGVSGFSLKGNTGDAEFNNLTLRGGIIGNDALTSPVVPFVDHRHVNNFPVSPTPNVLAPIDVPVPTGLTRAMVTCTAVGNLYNTSGALDFMSVFAVIEGDTDVGYSSQRTILNGELETASQTSTALLTGLSDSFRVYGRVNVQTQSIAANAANVCNVDVTVLFLR